MKFGFRTPSLKRRIAARTSWKRYVRHSMGLKMPRGYGFLTSPKKTLYNKVYHKTTFGIEDITKHSSKSASNTKTSESKVVPLPSYLPVSNDAPFAISPQSFIQLVKSPDKFGKDGWATVVIIIGVICIFGNPILGIVLLTGGGYWMYRITKEPWYKVKNNLRKAKKLLKSERFEEAVTPLQEAIKLEPLNSQLHYLLGVAFHCINKHQESIEHLKQYIEVESSDLDAKLVLAYSYYKNKQFGEIIPLLQQFPQDHPHYLLVILLLGDSFLSLKEYEMAIDVLKRGPTRKTNLDSYLLQLHYLLGTAYKEKGVKTDAIREFKRVYSFDMNYKEVKKELSELEGDNLTTNNFEMNQSTNLNI